MAMLAVLLCGAQTGRTQVTTATLNGIVADDSGGVVPGAEVTLTQSETNAVSAKTTNEIGEFVFTFVNPGTYTLRITSPGFMTSQHDNFVLRAAQNIRRRFTLQVGQVAETVEVSAQAVMINTGSTEQREGLSEMEVTQLPLSRRNVSDILDLNAGSVASGDRGRFNLNGLGGAGTKYTIDGTEASANPRDPGTSMAQGFSRIDLMSLDSIEEVQIVKGVIPAEYGHTLAGNVNIITKSGTNEIHGSLFYNYQGAGLAARHQFAETKPNFVWNQFGGSMGAPIVKDKIFVFGAYEGYRESNFRFLDDDVPTANFRQQMLDALPFTETQMILDTLPLPNTPHDDDDVAASWRGPGSQSARDNHVDAKGDVYLGNVSRLAVTYSRARPFLNQPRVSPANPRTFDGLSERVAASFTTGGAAWTSETRFGLNYNRTNRLDAIFNVGDPNQEEAEVGGRRLPEIRCCGFRTPGGEIRNSDPKPGFTLEEKFSRITGKHSLKFGGIYSYRGSGRFNVEAARLEYRKAEDLLANNATKRVQVTWGAPDFGARLYDIGFFVQDDWRVTQRLVLNLGLRYDYFSNYVAKPRTNVPAGLFTLDGLLDDQFNFGPVRDSSRPNEPDGINFGPRFGFAYDLKGDGNTVVRGGFSTMFTPVPVSQYILAVGRSPIVPFRARFSAKEAQQLGLQFPLYNEDVVPIVEASGQVRISDTTDPNVDAPYAFNMYLGVQRALTPSLMLETAWVGTRGVKFIIEREANRPDRVTGDRPNQDLSGLAYYDNSEQTFYSGWQTSLRKRFSRGLLFNLHYTWSKVLAYAGGDNSIDLGETTTNVQNFFCLRCERGYATSDRTHNFSATWVYELPRMPNSHAVVQHVLGGWQLSGIITAISGRPLQIEQSDNALNDQRPDISSSIAAVNECCQFGNLQYLNADAFIPVAINPDSGATVRPGSLGNHALRGPGRWNMDFSLAKNIPLPLREGTSLQIRGDFLNGLNHTNYTSVRTNIESGSFGRITNTAGARVVQLNAKITW